MTNPNIAQPKTQTATGHATEWQPIDSAPVGRNIHGYSWMLLAWGPLGDQSVGAGFRMNDKFFAAASFHCLAQKKRFEWREIEVTPTHWMKLPKAPEDVTQAQPHISKTEISRAMDQAIDAMRPLKDLIILRQAMGALEHAKNRMCIAQPDGDLEEAYRQGRYDESMAQGPNPWPESGPERKGLFIDLIAQHEGLAEELALMDSEPVAWMDGDGNVSDNNDHHCYPIPLYTTPQSVAYVPLTAETVFKVARQFKHIATLVPHVEVGEFAKAIERAVRGEK